MLHKEFGDVWPEERKCVYLYVYWEWDITAYSKCLDDKLPYKMSIISIFNNLLI